MGSLHPNVEYEHKLLGWDSSKNYSSWRFIATFDVSSNTFTGSLPAEYKAWTTLHNFVLPPEYSSWNATTTFDVSSNMLTGTLPSLYSTWGTSVETVLFTSNSFTGSIPPSFSAWRRIVSFGASNNNLSGTLPEAVSAWTKITLFVAGNNMLEGTLPGAYSSWSSLARVSLNANRLSGSIDPLFASWRSVSVFDLSNNHLNGTLPSELGAWTALGWFSVTNNAFTGTIPASYSAWMSVTSMTCSNNQLNGSLPPSFESWTHINTFSVRSNSLSGSIPSSYGAWSLVEHVEFTSNGFVGTLPESLYAWRQITYLSVAQNCLSGTLPALIGEKWNKIASLYLSSNAFTGTLPSTMSLLKSTLTILTLNCNNLSGTLPSSFSNLSALTDVAFANNPKLTGTLPNSWSALRLHSLSLQNTSVYGPIPASWTSIIVSGGVVAMCNNLLCGGAGGLSPIVFCIDDEAMCSNNASQTYLQSHAAIALLSSLPKCPEQAPTTGPEHTHSSTFVWDPNADFAPPTVALVTVLEIARTPASVLLGVVTGSAQGALMLTRTAALAHIVHCDAAVGTSVDSDTLSQVVRTGAAYLGAFLAISIFFALLVSWHSRRRCIPAARAAECLHLPGHAWCVVSGLIPAMLEFGLTISLLVSGSITNQYSDVGSAIALDVVLLGTGALPFLWQCSVATWRFRAEWRHTADKKESCCAGKAKKKTHRVTTLVDSCRAFWMKHHHPGKWIDAPSAYTYTTQRPTSFVEAYGPVFEECTNKRVWFVAWESGLAVLTSVLSAVSSAASSGRCDAIGSCEAIQITGALLEMCGLFMLGVARPQQHLQDWMVAMTVELIGFCAGTCLLVAAMLEGPASDNWGSASDSILQVQFYLGFLIFMVDAVLSARCLRALRRLCFVERPLIVPTLAQVKRRSAPLTMRAPKLRSRSTDTGFEKQFCVVCSTINLQAMIELICDSRRSSQF
ncbi:GP46-like surface antigen, putative [Bodo saltans]|uniref:GP46-like surface antigen, putative n=1 Tax=Bodo saltans TaxID=75058 RepID=A0A0S4JAD5_BODSA|nr:GP46-like surface antigen, putative [Bodo saltans]|eukprot:CUG88330.1 GP46-like surface antigen, putative [Bodo saltans]